MNKLLLPKFLKTFEKKGRERRSLVISMINDLVSYKLKDQINFKMKKNNLYLFLDIYIKFQQNR